MSFVAPIPFREAIQQVAVRQVLPTNMSHAELATLQGNIYANSFLSAKNIYTDLLDAQKQSLLDILSGNLDLATARLKAKQVAMQLGYQPDPDKRGTIQDLSSTKRINLVLQTQRDIAQGYGWDRQGQAPIILDEYPAQELYRAESRKKDRDWQARFRLAGSQTGDPIGTGWTITTDGRMIALKNHAIWSLLGSPKLFPDGLGNDFAPFAFSSGMDTRDVDRDEAMRIGLIDRDTQIQPKLDPFPLQKEAA